MLAGRGFSGVIRGTYPIPMPMSRCLGPRAQVWVFPTLADRLDPPPAEGGRAALPCPSLRPSGREAGLESGAQAPRPWAWSSGWAASPLSPATTLRATGALWPAEVRPGVPGAAQAPADSVCHQVLPLPPAGGHQVPVAPPSPFAGGSEGRGSGERAVWVRGGLSPRLSKL